MARDTCDQCGATLTALGASCIHCSPPEAVAADAEAAVATTVTANYLSEPAWQSVYRGLRAYRLGLILQFVSQIGSYFLPLLLLLIALNMHPNSPNPPKSAANLAAMVLLTTDIVVLVALVVLLLGQYWVGAVPSETRARGLAWFAFFMGIIALAFSAAPLFLDKEGKASELADKLELFRSVAAFLSAATFIVALGRIARVVESLALGRSAMILLVLLFLQIGLGYGYVVERNQYDISVFLLLGLGIVSLLYLLRFLSLLGTLSALIGKDDDDDDDDDLMAA